MPPRKSGPRGRSLKRKRPENDAIDRSIAKNDIFEAEDSDPEEERLAGKRYDIVDKFEYELPSDFEDEEIDEDEAFNSEDERMYGHLFPSKDSESEENSEDEDEQDEDEDGEENDEDSELDLLESSEDVDSEDEDASDLNEIDDVFDSKFGDSESESDQDSESKSGSEDEGNEEDSKLDANMVKALTGREKHQKHREMVMTESYPESEFNLPISGEGELTLEDLISNLGDGRAKLGSAKKTLEKLTRKSVPVDAPLPGPVKARQERRAGYETAKKDIEKWMPFVKANREAPTLHFKSDQSAVPKSTTTASIAAKHQPETPMEAEVAALLQAAGADTASAVTEAEEALSMKLLSVEEAKERRERLAKMRALLFYHEAKAKRMKKIKSKEYRRRLKKAARAKAAAAAEAITNEDGMILLDEDAIRKEREQAEFERAQERLTLKHKNTSRFIRRALQRGQHDMDDGTREAIAEQLRIGQELRSRINRLGHRTGRNEESDTDASDSASDDASIDGNESVPSKATEAALEILQGADPLDEKLSSKKGLFSLPFMQRAMERRKAAAEEEARNVLKTTAEAYSGISTAKLTNPNSKSNGRIDFQQLDAVNDVKSLDHRENSEHSDLESDTDEDAEAKLQRLGKKLGTMKDEPKDEVLGLGTETVVSDNSTLEKIRLQGSSARDALFESNQTISLSVKQQKNLRASDISVGPKRQSTKPAGTCTLKSSNESDNTDANAIEYIASESFAGQKSGYVFKKGANGTGYYLDSLQTKKGNKMPKATKARKGNARMETKVSKDSDVPNLLISQNHNKKLTANGPSQEELVRRAFAGDDVAATFAAEKQAEVEAELPSSDVPGELPGWGTWASQKREPQWVQAARAKAEAKRKKAAAARRDADLQAVIISEKWDKKNAKYRTPSVPFPFDSKDTYERAMRQPLGKDFNTDAAFRSLTRPSVVKDAGVIIEPIRYSEKMSEYASKIEKGSRRSAVTVVAGGMPMRAKKRH